MNEDIKNISAVPGHDDWIQFIDSHRVSLPTGDYSLTVTQAIKGETWQRTQAFSVRGERFLLPPNAVRAVYPPAGSRGDYWHTLPHIVLERSTLPWERSALKKVTDLKTAPPWLALLVFHPDDPAPEIKIKAIKDFKPGDLKGQNPDEEVQVISVQKSMLPTLDELGHLTHVRRRLAVVNDIQPFKTKDAAINYVKRYAPQTVETEIVDAKEKEAISKDLGKAWILRDHAGDETYEVLKMKSKSDFKLFHVAHEATSLIANRLPMPGGRNIVHLVSMEDVFPITAAGDDIELASLYQWEFFCEDEKITFTTVLEKLAKTASDLKLPVSETAVKPYLTAGYTPLRHRFREGSRSVSWYHGPLIPVKVSLSTDPLTATDDDVRQADDLVVFDVAQGMFDVSYAAAWELGRLLTLQNTKLAIALYNWKRQNAHQLYAFRHLAENGYHLPGAPDIPLTDPDAGAISDWMDELSLLRHVPFQYLVPDPRLLPPESMRFFRLDPTWTQYLRDGAFSVGEVLALDAENKLHQESKKQAPYTGFLLRSELTSHWPQVQMTAWAVDPPPDVTKLPDVRGDAGVLTPVRKEQLSKQVLLVIFKGEVKAVDFFLPPETLHFGFDEPDGTGSEAPLNLKKTLRNPDTGAVDTTKTPLPIRLRDAGKRVIDITAMVPDLKGDGSSEVHSGTLALQLIAGNELVRISR